MKGRALFLALLILTGCGADTEPPGVPPELVGLKENVFRCVQDARWTYPERSEHCVLAAEGLLESYREDCEQNTNGECMTWKLAHTDLALGFQNAISDSLFTRGISAEVEKLGRSNGFWVYRQGELMRSLFKQCLAEEARELEAAGLIKVTTIMIRPLQSGQRCFRKGYPEFRTKNVGVS